MSTMRLMVLGLVSSLQPVHGHDVRRALLGYDGRAAATVPAGSVYHALRTLTQEGLLKAVTVERNGGRSTRVVYRATPAGSREFRILLRRSWSQYQHPNDPFVSALTFLPALPRAEAVTALRNRAVALRARAIGQRLDLDLDLDDADERSEHVRWQVERAMRWFEVEAEWCTDVANRVESGMGLHVNDQQVGTDDITDTSPDITGS